MTLHFYNVLSKQQLAQAYVASYPWITEWISRECLALRGWQQQVRWCVQAASLLLLLHAAAVSEALDELGW